MALFSLLTMMIVLKWDKHLDFKIEKRNAGCLNNRDNPLTMKTVACAYVAIVQQQQQILVLYYMYGE